MELLDSNFGCYNHFLHEHLFMLSGDQVFSLVCVDLIQLHPLGL